MTVVKMGNENSAAASCSIDGRVMKTNTRSPEVDKKWPTIGATTGEDGKILEICAVDLFIWALRDWFLV
jgi:hypothetical protein